MSFCSNYLPMKISFAGTVLLHLQLSYNNGQSALQ